MVDESGNMEYSEEPAGDAAQGDWSELPLVPLFPLPNVVLFPRAVLPLHIFEDRYKAMTRHALEGDRRIAMALLRPGWEKRYYGKPAIEPVVCVGHILSAERLEDGCYNCLLQGTHRARIVCEIAGQPYRQAQVRLYRPPPVMEIDLAYQRQWLWEALCTGPLASTPLVKQFEHVFAGPIPISDVADLVAFTFLDDVTLKQSLLVETDVVRRIEQIHAALTRLPPLASDADHLAFANPRLN